MPAAGKRSSEFVLAGFRLWRKSRVGRNEILKIPPILQILILTKARDFAFREYPRAEKHLTGRNAFRYTCMIERQFLTD